MLNAAFPFCVERYIGMGSGLRLGHLLLACEEAEALELGSAPGHSILLGFLPQSGAVRVQFQCFSHLSSLHCKYISNVESGICLSFSSFISVHFFKLVKSGYLYLPEAYEFYANGSINFCHTYFPTAYSTIIRME